MARPGNNAAQNRWIIAGLWLFLYASFALLSPPLLDGVESVRAEAAREMVLRADPAAFTLLGAPYAEPAPLLTWCTAAILHVAGADVAQVRLPAALAVLLLAWLVEGFSRRTFRSSRAGLYAAAVLLLSGGLFACTRLDADAVLPCLFATLAVLCFAWAEFVPWGYSDRAPLLPMLGFGVACGLGVLAGGGIAVAAVGLAVLVYELRTRGARAATMRLRGMHPAATLAAFLLVAAPWYVYLLHGHKAWFQVFSFKETRWPFLLFLLGALLPWSVFLPAALDGARIPQRSPSVPRLLAMAALMPLLFAAVQAVLEKNFAGTILLSVPFCAVLLGRWLDQEASEAECMTVPLPLSIAGVRASAVLLAGAVAAAAVCVSLLLHGSQRVTLLRAGVSLSDLQAMTAAAQAAPGALRLMALVLPVGTLLNLNLRRGFKPAAGNMTLAATALLVLSALHTVLNAVSPALTSQPFATVLAKELRPGNLVVVSGDLGAAATLAFSLQREEIELLPATPAPSELLQGKASLPGTEGTLRQQWRGPERIFLLTDAPQRPALPGKAWIVAESGGRQLLSNKPAAY